MAARGRPLRCVVMSATCGSGVSLTRVSRCSSRAWPWPV
nr:MAG TPA: hypothetical protein [Caudoviricetes sp.]